MNAKRALSAFVIATVLFLCIASLGRCKIPPKTPGDTRCKAEMDATTCKKFQELLKMCGHDLVVMEGTAFATAKQAKQKTFAAILKCRDSKGNVMCVIVRYVKDNLAGIEIRPTGEKCTGM